MPNLIDIKWLFLERGNNLYVLRRHSKALKTICVFHPSTVLNQHIDYRQVNISQLSQRSQLHVAKCLRAVEPSPWALLPSSEPLKSWWPHTPRSPGAILRRRPNWVRPKAIHAVRCALGRRAGHRGMKKTADPAIVPFIYIYIYDIFHWYGFIVFIHGQSCTSCISCIPIWWPHPLLRVLLSLFFLLLFLLLLFAFWSGAVPLYFAAFGSWNCLIVTGSSHCEWQSLNFGDKISPVVMHFQECLMPKLATWWP